MTLTARLDPAAPEPSAETLLVGSSAAIREVRRLIRQVAPTTASVLITGPSGSGKELVARAIHVESVRADAGFVAVNCGAIPRDLLESELFGHERGAFTGAVAQKTGRFEDASGGTLFLDEIGDMPLEMQVKLLRVLEERSINRVGGRTTIPVDVRIVSATHRDITTALDTQSFREDLFYRLAVFPIRLPALCERTEDVPLLVEHFLERAADARGRVRLTNAAVDRLVDYRWPGNIRELRNVIDRATILHAGAVVDEGEVEALLNRRPQARAAERDALWSMTSPDPGEAPPAPRREEPAPEPASAGPVDLKALVAAFEKRHIIDALRRSRGVVADAARLLTLQRSTLIDKMQKYGIDREA